MKPNTQFFDLSQPIENQMMYFPGDPQPRIHPAVGVEAPWRVSELHIGSHTGTHIDAAAHYLPQGRTIDGYPLERFILPGCCVFIPGLGEDDPIDLHHLAESGWVFLKGGALVIRTDWDRFWGQEQYLRHPYLSPKAAQFLVAAGVSLVGIDALNVDSTLQGTTHVHQMLLGRDLLIVENLTRLSQLKPGERYMFSFLPLSLAGLDGSPVRAIAWK